jgi:hypothetical protein
MKVGDKVVLEGKSATIEAAWGAGKHTKYVLSDGREVLDLDKLVESGVAKLAVSEVPKPAVSFRWPTREKLPEGDTDIEE